jgi:hypothetical protein
VRELGDEVLKKIAVEVTEKLRNSTSVDWQKRESVRARLRNLVRITLRRYKYRRICRRKPTGWCWSRRSGCRKNGRSSTTQGLGSMITFL